MTKGFSEGPTTFETLLRGFRFESHHSTAEVMALASLIATDLSDALWDTAGACGSEHRAFLALFKEPYFEEHGQI